MGRKKRFEIHEMWIDEERTLCQVIVYYSDTDPRDRTDVNVHLTKLIHRSYFDMKGKLIKEENFK